MTVRSNEEVDQWAESAKSTEGRLIIGPKIDENGFYVCVFADPDGHKFNIVCMDEGM